MPLEPHHEELRLVHELEVLAPSDGPRRGRGGGEHGLDGAA
ncbi:MAG: hypothetical protein ACRDVW_00195 [Acidimicrobiales bacterium]